MIKKMLRTSCASAAIMMMGLASAAQAQGELVIATFGGSFGDDTQACHVAAFEEKTGAKAILTFGSSVDNAARIRATAGDPEIDVAYMDISIAKQIKNEGLLETLPFDGMGSFPQVAEQAFDADDQ